MKQKLCEFEKNVLAALKKCGFDFSDGLALGAAVSGGADSISLLYSLAEILRFQNIPLFVITVNHFIRPDEETCADAAFVVKECESLRSRGYDVTCEPVELARGEVERLSKERGAGLEEAARFLRYQAFDSFIKKHKLSALCLAHNKNDQLETLLMRFLQGSWVDTAGGIQKRRGSYIRPLLDISRDEIEAYLRQRSLVWRTDSTNSDTSYFRNRVRNILVPLLNENFEGWQTALLSGGEKAVMDSAVILQSVNNVPIDDSKQGEGQISVLRKDFDPLADGIKIRVMMKMCGLLEKNQAGENSERIPFSFFKDVLSAAYGSSGGAAQAVQTHSPAQTKPFSKFFSDIEISVKKDCLFVKKHKKIHTDLVFFDIIEEKGSYDFPFGRLFVQADGQIIINDFPTDLKCRFPFCVRNFCPGDEVLNAEGKMKSIADVFAGWKIPERERALVPLIQALNEEGEIKALLAGFLGYKDWIVK